MVNLSTFASACMVYGLMVKNKADLSSSRLSEGLRNHPKYKQFLNLTKSKVFVKYSLCTPFGRGVRDLCGLTDVLVAFNCFRFGSSLISVFVSYFINQIRVKMKSTGSF